MVQNDEDEEWRRHRRPGTGVHVRPVTPTYTEGGPDGRQVRASPEPPEGPPGVTHGPPRAPITPHQHSDIPVRRTGSDLSTKEVLPRPLPLNKRLSGVEVRPSDPEARVSALWSLLSVRRDGPLRRPGSLSWAWLHPSSRCHRTVLVSRLPDVLLLGDRTTPRGRRVGRGSHGPPSCGPVPPQVPRPGVFSPPPLRTCHPSRTGPRT